MRQALKLPSLLVTALALSHCASSADTEAPIGDPSPESTEIAAQDSDLRNDHRNIGTGDAKWTIRNRDGSTFRVFVALRGDATPVIESEGSLAKGTSLPHRVVNAEGETLTIYDGREPQTLNIKGEFQIELNPATASGCTECNCGFDIAGPCRPAFSLTDCSSGPGYCFTTPCASSGGGGGVELGATDFAANIPHEW